MPMKRRAVLRGLGSAAVVGPGLIAGQGHAGAEKPAAQKDVLPIEQYQPRSMLHANDDPAAPADRTEDRDAAADRDDARDEGFVARNAPMMVGQAFFRLWSAGYDGAGGYRS